MLVIGGDQGAVSGQTPPPPPRQSLDPANVQIMNEYNSFNLANVTPPVAPKWKQTDTLLDDFCTFKHSSQRIFDGPMCHITSGKVKTGMLLIWTSPDDEDIYERFDLPPHQANDINIMLQEFEEFCEPVCNFRAARFKFTKVTQHQGEAIDTFYNRILKLAHQCDFSDPDERMIDTIILGTNCVKAQDKLLQIPKMLSLQQCLTVCHHYERLKLHIQEIRPYKHVEFLRRHHPTKKKLGSKPFNQQRSQSQSQSKNQMANTQTGQQSQSQSKFLPYSKCSGCGHDHHSDRAQQCPAWGQTCRKCSRQNHYEIVCGMQPPRRR